MYCEAHQTLDGSFECSRCQRLHCLGCVRWIGHDRGKIPACSACDGLLLALNVRTVPKPRDDLRELLGRLGHPTGVATLVAFGVLGGAADLPLPILNVLIDLAYLAALAATYLNVVDHVARDQPGFPAPEEPEGWPATTLLSRGALLLLVAFTPFGLWLAVNRGAESAGELFSASPVRAFLVLGLTLLWFTAAVLAMVDNLRGLAAFWPPALVAVVQRGPRIFLSLYAEVVLTASLCWILRSGVRYVVGTIPFVGSFLLALVTGAVLLAQAALVGGFLRRHRDLFRLR
jgi:hypothetical protein